MRRRSRRTRRSTASFPTTSSTGCNSPRPKRRQARDRMRSGRLIYCAGSRLRSGTTRASTAQKRLRPVHCLTTSDSRPRLVARSRRGDSREPGSLVASALLLEGNAWQELGELPTKHARSTRLQAIAGARVARSAQRASRCVRRAISRLPNRCTNADSRSPGRLEIRVRPRVC